MKQTTSLLLAVVLGLSGCHAKAPTQTPLSDADLGSPADGSVGFDIVSSATTSGGMQEWTATYATKDGVTRFKFRLSPDEPKGDGSFGAYGVGKGMFIAVSGSNPEPLMNALKIALEASSMPRHVRRQQTVAFTYATFGSGWNREKGGGFDNKRQGTWTAMKVFLTTKSEGDTEVFLNLSPATGKGEFAIKDPDYGNDVLAVLAGVR